MKNGTLYFILLLTLLYWNCTNNKKFPIAKNTIIDSSFIVPKVHETNGNTIKTRIHVPHGFVRSSEKSNTFQAYLRHLKLKPKDSKVKYYNGQTKPNRNIYVAVVDLAIGNKDLHQCADAIMRLRSEYLWEQKRYNDIHFNFTNGQKVAYKEWMDGKRMNIQGNKTWWSHEATPSNEYKDFWNYMELIFTYAGTASLEKELTQVPIHEAQIGDILIQGGHPGHAVIIVDKAINTTTGAPIYLLAQSYMPAQEIQILQNPLDSNLSPWYQLQMGSIITPEWRFNSHDLKRFEE